MLPGPLPRMTPIPSQTRKLEVNFDIIDVTFADDALKEAVFGRQQMKKFSLTPLSGQRSLCRWVAGICVGFAALHSAVAQPISLRYLLPQDFDGIFWGSGIVSTSDDGQTALVSLWAGGTGIVRVSDGVVLQDLSALRVNHGFSVLSGDASTVVGYAIRENRTYPNTYSARYVLSEGLTPMAGVDANGPVSDPQCVSRNGQVVAGYLSSVIYGQAAYRWTNGSGLEVVNNAAMGSNYSFPMDTSADGSSLLLYTTFNSNAPVFRVWNSQNNFFDLQNDSAGRVVSAGHISGDGALIAGTLSNPNFNLGFVPVSIALWNGAGQMTEIGAPIQAGSAHITAVDSTGNWVAMRFFNEGDPRWYTYLWSQATGFMDINAFLLNAGVPLDDFPSWPVYEITSISDDGRIFTGQMPGGVPFVLTIPLPSAAAFLGFGMLAVVRRRR